MPRVLSPRLLGAHLAALLAVGAALALGIWQYHAWQNGRADAAADRTHASAVELTTVIGPDDPFPGNEIGQPVELSGTWVPAGTVYVSGREHQGRDGYWVVTPLAIGTPDGSAVPVVRGWVVDPADAPAPPTGSASLVGWLQPPEGSGQTDPDQHDDVLPEMRVADLLQHLDQDLYGAYVVADGATTAVNDGTTGLVPGDLAQLPAVGSFTAARNLLYALEWWIFGGFAGFIWWRFLRDELVSTDASKISAGDPVPSEP